MPSLSFVIPAYNEEQAIRLCLEALTPQLADGDEVIVVDNNSKDGTAAVAAAYPRVKVVPETRAGVTYAVPTGMNLAAGDVIVRIDSDCIVRHDYVARLKALFDEHPDLDGMSGLAGIAELSPKGRIWFDWYFRGFRRWHEHSTGIKPVLYGFNSAIRREAWERGRELMSVGDKRFMDDVDMSIAMHRSGAKLVYAPQVRVATQLFRSVTTEKLKGYYRRDEMTMAKHGYGKQRRRARGERNLAKEPVPDVLLNASPESSGAPGSGSGQAK